MSTRNSSTLVVRIRASLKTMLGFFSKDDDLNWERFQELEAKKYRKEERYGMFTERSIRDMLIRK